MKTFVSSGDRIEESKVFPVYSCFSSQETCGLAYVKEKRLKSISIGHDMRVDIILF